MDEGATSLEKFLVETNINHIGQPGDPPDQTLAELTALVLELNRRLEVAPPDLTGDLAEKLAKWLQRLMAKMKKIAKAMNALSYTISVGTGGVSVSVTLDPKAL